MMQANEIRVGNIILKEGEPFVVTPYTILIVERDPDQFDPIPLTEDLLIKAGFEKRGKSTVYTNDVFVIVNIYRDGLYRVSKSVLGEYIDIKYLHQLQNLFYSLTSTELPIQL